MSLYFSVVHILVNITSLICGSNRFPDADISYRGFPSFSSFPAGSAMIVTYLILSRDSLHPDLFSVQHSAYVISFNAIYSGLLLISLNKQISFLISCILRAIDKFITNKLHVLKTENITLCFDCCDSSWCKIRVAVYRTYHSFSFEEIIPSQDVWRQNMSIIVL